MKIITFFNNKGGVGKTTLVYHIGHMLSRLGVPTLMADLDPQSNLTSLCLPDERLELLWPDSDEHPLTIAHAVDLVKEGDGDIRPAHVEPVPHADNLYLIPGDIALTGFESTLASAFSSRSERKAAKDTSSLFRVLEDAAIQTLAQVVLVDIGPNFGAINHAALLASDHIILPLAPDLFSQQGLRNLGPTLRAWRADWRRDLEDFRKDPKIKFNLPRGEMSVAGYVAMNFNLHGGTPTKAYKMWIERMPSAYRTNILDEQLINAPDSIDKDSYCLAKIPNYQSLMPRAHEARKPIFALRAADEVYGSQLTTARVEVHQHFQDLTKQIAARCGITLP